ncbi:Aft10-1 [Alternaria alternata]|nr:Aft10-1 [Alternaria alternata]
MHDVRLPGDVSPREWDEFHGLVVADEVARCGSLGVLWALGCGTAIACPILVNYGTEEQKAKFLPPVIHGESRFCLGITEPEGFDHHRSWIAANCLRLARVCLEDAYQYALTRQTFGRPLIDHQAIRLKVANVGLQITSSYALLESLIEMRQNLSTKIGQAHSGIGGLYAITKVAAARAFELAVRESQQIMGAAAYTRTGPGLRIERLSRDMRVLVIGGGSEEILTEMSVVQEQKDLNKCEALS